MRTVRNKTSGEGGKVHEEALEQKVEVDVGHRRYHREYVGEGYQVMPAFIGEKVRLKGELIRYFLYRCPGGYRVYRSELHYRRRKERYRWQKGEAFSSLFPTVNKEDACQNEQT